MPHYVVKKQEQVGKYLRTPLMWCFLNIQFDTKVAHVSRQSMATSMHCKCQLSISNANPPNPPLSYGEIEATNLLNLRSLYLHPTSCAKWLWMLTSRAKNYWISIKFKVFSLEIGEICTDFPSIDLPLHHQTKYHSVIVKFMKWHSLAIKVSKMLVAMGCYSSES